MSKPTHNGDNRRTHNPDGTWAKGNPGGPGRPKGSVSIIGELREWLRKNPDAVEEIRDAIVERCRAGDVKMLNTVLERLEGRAPQVIEQDTRITFGERTVGDGTRLAEASSELVAAVSRGPEPDDPDGTPDGENGSSPPPRR